MYRTILNVTYTIASIFLLASASAPTTTRSSDIQGYWEGEFMPGNNFTLILHFSPDGSGRINLFKGDAEMQDDPLSDIVIEDTRLSFFIAAKETRFEGELNAVEGFIRGNFTFPNGEAVPLLVHKVDKPSITSLVITTAAENIENILEKKYTPGELRVDLGYLKQKLATHPQAFLYLSQTEFDAIFTKVIERDMTEDEFFRLLAPSVASIGCCHTGIRPSEKYAAALSDRATLLPLTLYFSAETAFVLDDYSENPSLLPGTEIRAINGVPVPEIVQRLLDCLPADGFSRTSKFCDIQDDFAAEYSLYIGNPPEFILDGSTRENRDLHVVVPAITPEKRRRKDQTPQGPPYSFRLDARRNTALLTIAGFWAPDWEDYARFLKEFFTRLDDEHIGNLVIDLRGNRGGPPFFAAELLSYIAKSDFVYFASLQEDEFRPLTEPQKAKKECFSGDIYILMDGGCRSTTGHFLSLVRYHRLAVLVGEEPGGSFYCNDNSVQLKLPNTGIRLNLPRTTYQTAVTGFTMGEPLQPDIAVRSGLQDKLANRDTVLNFILDHITAAQK